MKATRKVSRRSFIHLVSGGATGGGALTALVGQSRHNVENDHDLAHPAMDPGGGDPDSTGPDAH